MGFRVRGLSSGQPPSLRGLVGTQARGRRGQEPQPSLKGQALLIPVSLDIGEGVWCRSSLWDSKSARGSRVQVRVGERPVGGWGQQSFRGSQQLMVEPGRGPGGRSWSFVGV